MPLILPHSNVPPNTVSISRLRSQHIKNLELDISYSISVQRSVKFKRGKCTVASERSAEKNHSALSGTFTDLSRLRPAGVVNVISWRMNFRLIVLTRQQSLEIWIQRFLGPFARPSKTKKNLDSPKQSLESLGFGLFVFYFSCGCDCTHRAVSAPEYWPRYKCYSLGWALSSFYHPQFQPPPETASHNTRIVSLIVNRWCVRPTAHRPSTPRTLSTRFRGCYLRGTVRWIVNTNASIQLPQKCDSGAKMQSSSMESGRLFGFWALPSYS